MGEEITTVKLGEAKYPKLLSQIPDSPAKLWLRGKLPSEDKIAVAVVGTRKASTYGLKVTLELVRPLAEAGVVVVSGLALGIDGAAHQAALESGGETLAVLGSGVDKIYPASHASLARKILQKGGAILSEFPPGTEAKPHHFPQRNRIIAGLSRAVLVVEAPIHSGALITARLAADYNRDVWAVPAGVFFEAGQGTNWLLKQGAKVVTSPDDILEELGLEAALPQESKTKLTEPQKQILEALAEPQAVDSLARVVRIEVASLQGLLLELEIKGLVKSLGSGVYGKSRSSASK